MINEVLTGQLKRLCSLFGSKFLADFLTYMDEDDEYKFGELFEKFIQRLEQKFTSKLFHFNDRTNQTVVKYFVIQYRGDITAEGEPIIVINDFPPGLKAEKNPVVDLVLTYDDVDVRDKDLEELKFMIS